MPSIYVEPLLIRGRLRATGHVFTPRPLALERERDAGERRSRPVRRSPPPQRLQGEWYLDSQARFDAFFDWFEDELRAGAEQFDVLVAGQGGTTPSWWSARFLSPPQYSARRGLRWDVQVELLLLDEIGATREAPGISANGADTDTGGAYVRPGTVLATGTDADTGGWYVPATGLFASGTDEDGGGFDSGLAPAAEAEDLIRLWMGLDLDPPVIEDEEALMAQHMGFGT